jgi:hypothetical protein
LKTFVLPCLPGEEWWVSGLLAAVRDGQCWCAWACSLLMTHAE